MRAAATKLKSTIDADRIIRFESQPTYNLYISILSSSPTLQASLLSTVRCLVTKPVATGLDLTIPISAAIKIFMHAKANDDLAILLDKSNPLNLGTPERIGIIKYLMKQSNGGYTSKMRDYLEHGLSEAVSSIYDGMQDLFQNSIDEAYDYLDNNIGAGKLTKHAPAKIDKVRDSIMDEFACIVRLDSTDGMDVMYYSDDSEHEGRRDAQRSNLADDLQRWCSLLQEWSDQTEAAEIRNKVFGKENLIFAVDGAADAMADAYVALSLTYDFLTNPVPPRSCESCDYDTRHSMSEAHISGGIRALNKAYREDAQRKRKATPAMAGDLSKKSPRIGK
jgi:hypothetical protein